MIDAVSTTVMILGHLVLTAGAVAALRVRCGSGPLSMFETLVLAATCLLLAVFTFLAVDPAYLFSDFRIAYYPAGRAVIESPAALKPIIDLGVHGFVNLPILAYLFAPEALLPLRAAIPLFFVIGVALTLVAWLVLVIMAGLQGAERWLLLLLFAANGPLQYSLKEGNTSHWVLLALVLGLYFLRRERSYAAGVTLGLAAVLKLPLLLFGVYFALRRDWRAVLGFGALCAAAVCLSVIVFGWDFLLHWYDACVRPFSREWLAAFNVQSVQSFVLRWHGTSERLNDWTAAWPTVQQRVIAYGLVGTIYLAALCCGISARRRHDVVGSRASGPRTTLEFTMVLCLALVSSPVSWSHYYAWLLLPAAFFIAPHSVFATRPVVRTVGWAAILLATPLVRTHHFLGAEVVSGYVDVAISHLLLAALVWFGLACWSLVFPATAEAFEVLSPSTPIGATGPVAMLDSVTADHSQKGTAARAAHADA